MMIGEVEHVELNSLVTWLVDWCGICAGLGVGMGGCEQVWVDMGKGG